MKREGSVEAVLRGVKERRKIFDALFLQRRALFFNSLPANKKRGRKLGKEKRAREKAVLIFLR